MKKLTQLLLVAASAFALFGLSSCSDSAPVQVTPVYEVPAK